MKLSFITLLILTPILLFFWSCSETGGADQTLKARQGMMDLREWHVETKKEVPLIGEWEFYWNKLLEPDEFKTPATFAMTYQQVPHIWNLPRDGENFFPSNGYGTYRLKILMGSADYDMAIQVTEIYTSYRLWINGREIFQTGKPGTSRNESTPKLIPRVTPFTAEEEMEIVFQVSNFFYKDGGIRNPIILGDRKHLTLKREMTLVLNFALLGALLIMGLYHFGLYYQRPKDKSLLYFGLYCLIMTSRVLVTNENFIIYLIPSLTWQLNIRIIVFGYYLGVPVFASFVYHLFPLDFNKKILKIIQWIGGSACFLPLFTPVNFFTKTEVYYQIFIALIILYVFFILFLASFRKREASILLSIGLSIFLITVINDILYAQYFNRITTVQSMIPIGLFLFTLIQAYILSLRFSKAFTNANTDELTQVKNRRCFWELAQLERERSERNKSPFSLISMDIDFFKQVNDTYGHAAGDLVLKTVTRLISDNIRAIDIFGRIGGEEFALLLPDTEIRSAELLANRIRTMIESESIPVNVSKKISITISMGIYQFCTNGEEQPTLDEIMNYSDKALYEAKKNGRNRIELYTL